MGYRASRKQSSGLSFLVRLVSCVLALFVLCVTGRASAAPSNQAVPMCGERNESIAAPPILLPTDGGSLRATPCKPGDVLGTSPNAPPAPERVIVYERPERVLGAGALCVESGSSSRLGIGGGASALDRPGFVGTLFRPPRA